MSSQGPINKRGVYLAVDLGASGGRAVVGAIRAGKLEWDEIYRFPNAPCRLGNRLYWDFLALWGHVLESLRRCAERGHSRLAGIWVDTWGVDFGLLGPDGQLLANPLCYRDAITEGAEEAIRSALPEDEVFRLTGLMVSRVSTLAQLTALARSAGAEVLDCARTLLLMPDLFRYFLCGQKAVELTPAGTSALVDVRSGDWCRAILHALELPERILPPLVRPGTIAGALDEDLAHRVGLKRATVIAVAGHDTASAAAAVPFADEGSAFISCGTWSVIGAVRREPITTSDAREQGFVNELGLDSILFCKNIMGLYLFENLWRKLAAADRGTTYARLVREARAARPFGCFVDVTAPGFFVAPDSQTAVLEFLRKTGQKAVRGTGAVVRALLESLAWNYRAAIEQLGALVGRRIERISMVGGGTRNALLCQMTADATGLEVVAGPAEATAVGNLAVQALACGQLAGPGHIRDLVLRSCTLKTYRPKEAELWNKKIESYRQFSQNPR